MRICLQVIGGFKGTCSTFFVGSINVLWMLYIVDIFEESTDQQKTPFVSEHPENAPNKVTQPAKQNNTLAGVNQRALFLSRRDSGNPKPETQWSNPRDLSLIALVLIAPLFFRGKIFLVVSFIQPVPFSHRRATSSGYCFPPRWNPGSAPAKVRPRVARSHTSAYKQINHAIFSIWIVWQSVDSRPIHSKTQGEFF